MQGFRAWLQVGLITFLALALYGALRSLPNEVCGLLHINPSVLNDKGVAFCGEGEALFVELDTLRFPVEIEGNFNKTFEIGTPQPVTFRLKDYQGARIDPYALAITHTRLLHLMLISDDLQDYQHLHPRVLPDGSFQFDFTPRRLGTYRAIVAFALTQTQSKVVLTEALQVHGSGQESLPHGLPQGYRLRWKIPPTLTTGTDHRLEVRVERIDGRPAHLGVVMGSYAHLLVVDTDRKGFAHLHPTYTGKETDPSPQLAFVLNTSTAGTYRLWVQLVLEGQACFVPLDIVLTES